MTTRRPRRRRVHAAHGPSHERWLVSYADFITLLFAFFTTMYAISTVDAQKLSSVVDSMQDAFDSPRAAAPHGDDGARTGATSASSLTAAQRERLLAETLRRQFDGRAVDVDIDHRGIVVSMREAGSFPTGSADLSPVAREVLSELAATLGPDATTKLRVEGHTDDVPILTGRFASNWELSTARATSVVTYLVQQVGLTPQRLSAAGYGEYHPRVQNVTEADRARNRRVDVVILNEATAQAEEPRGPAPAVETPAPPSTLPRGRAFAG